MSTPLVSPSVQDMLTAARRLLRQPDPSNSQWTDEDLLAWLNEAVRIHMCELTGLDEGHFTGIDDLNIVSGTETIALPTDCFMVKVVYKKVNNGFVPLNYRNTLNVGYSTQGGTSPELYQPYYFFRGNSLVVRPVPNFSETDGIRVEYFQMPAILTDSSDQLSAQIAPVFRQSVEAYVVYMAKLSESLTSGTNTAALAEKHFNGLYSQFQQLSQKRSKNPTYIQPFNPED
jgi:hypothetical protein